MKLCPSCKEQTLSYNHGCGFDNDAWLCLNQGCNYERVLEVSTYPKESEQSQENEELHISGFELEA